MTDRVGRRTRLRDRTWGEPRVTTIELQLDGERGERLALGSQVKDGATGR
ncbi:hypothetical protein WMF31_40685 [Sorangium sp. So ce1036]